MPPPNVPYHKQEGEDHCGAACLQMVIEALGLKSKDQHGLFQDSHGHGRHDPIKSWASPPDGMEWTLRNRAGKTGAGSVLLELAFELPLTRGLVWSLFRHSFPPIALVYGLEHWVVVVNYDVSRDAEGPSDAGYEVRGLYIHNPWRTLKENDPPPPPPPHHVTMKTWQRTYLKRVDRGHWQGKIVALGMFAP